jgi:hypothetical protein
MVLSWRKVGTDAFMTLFHLIAITSYCLFIAVLSRICGFEPFSVGLIGAVGILIVWWFFSAYRKRKAYPKCRECSTVNYKAVGWAKEIGIENAGVVFECKTCGKKYLQTRTKFMILDKDNQPSGFMERATPKDMWEAEQERSQP